MAIQLKNNCLMAEFSREGGEMIRLQDVTGREYLWSGDPQHWRYHSPVLFPFVGKQAGGAFRYAGKSYPIGQHGFARTSTFHLQEQTDETVEFVLRSDEKTRSLYPFEFELVNRYELAGNKVVVSWRVKNPFESELHFQIGAHPAFLVPAGAESKKTECCIRFSPAKAYRYIKIDLAAGAAVPDETFALPLDENGDLKVRPGLFDIDTYIFENAQIEEVSLCGKDSVPYLTLRCPDFPYFGMWSPSDEAPFICLEPWYGRLDDRGFAGEIDEKAGMLHLKPGQEWKASYEIIIHQV